MCGFSPEPRHGIRLPQASSHSCKTDTREQSLALEISLRQIPGSILITASSSPQFHAALIGFCDYSTCLRQFCARKAKPRLFPCPPKCCRSRPCGQGLRARARKGECTLSASTDGLLQVDKARYDCRSGAKPLNKGLLEADAFGNVFRFT